MNPIFLDLSGFSIHTYGVFASLGFIVATLLILRKAIALGVSINHMVDIIFWTTLIAVVGSRALYVIANPDQFQSWTQWLNIRGGGLVFYGALVSGLPAAAILLRMHRISLLAFLDVIAISLPVGHAIARMGCFAAGCCYGRPTDVAWGVTYSHPLSVAPAGVSLHPTQLYEVIALICIAIGVGIFSTLGRRNGQTIALYLGLYAILRPILETFRYDETRGWFLESWLGQSLSTSQGISIIIGLAAVGLLVASFKFGSTPSSPQAPKTTAS